MQELAMELKPIRSTVECRLFMRFYLQSDNMDFGDTIYAHYNIT